VNVCIPVMKDDGLASRVSGHFGSAPAFLIVDTASRQCRIVVNTNAHHVHGACQPLGALAGHSVDAFVVAGIGGGALAKIASRGLPIYRATAPTVGELVDALAANRLPAFAVDDACTRGHHHG
jgi:predicted Fe-Mo cluster-binding NifX family protein